MRAVQNVINPDVFQREADYSQRNVVKLRRQVRPAAGPAHREVDHPRHEQDVAEHDQHQE